MSSERHTKSGKQCLCSPPEQVTPQTQEIINSDYATHFTTKNGASFTHDLQWIFLALPGFIPGGKIETKPSSAFSLYFEFCNLRHFLNYIKF